jgi:hypothetical protein
MAMCTRRAALGRGSNNHTKMEFRTTCLNPIRHEQDIAAIHPREGEEGGRNIPAFSTITSDRTRANLRDNDISISMKSLRDAVLICKGG